MSAGATGARVMRKGELEEYGEREKGKSERSRWRRRVREGRVKGSSMSRSIPSNCRSRIRVARGL